MLRYVEQWDRVKRWYSKIYNFSNIPSSVDQIDALDTTYAFFINCYHLKDWVKISRPELKSEIENLFDDKKGLTCFSICAGLANGSKHLAPDMKRPNHGAASVVGQSVNVHLPILTLNNEENAKKRAQVIYRWTIESNGNLYDAYGLAKSCIQEWESYLKNKNLI